MKKQSKDDTIDSYFYVGLTFFIVSLVFLGAFFSSSTVSPMIGIPFLVLGIVFMTWSSAEKKKTKK